MSHDHSHIISLRTGKDLAKKYSHYKCIFDEKKGEFTGIEHLHDVDEMWLILAPHYIYEGYCFRSGNKWRYGCTLKDFIRR
jgi:hypothetical protein